MESKYIWIVMSIELTCLKIFAFYSERLIAFV
jgi:hypothetical protein